MASYDLNNGKIAVCGNTVTPPGSNLVGKIGDRVGVRTTYWESEEDEAVDVCFICMVLSSLCLCVQDKSFMIQSIL